MNNRGCTAIGKRFALCLKKLQAKKLSPKPKKHEA
jgi:hypothetical protein